MYLDQTLGYWRLADNAAAFNTSDHSVVSAAIGRLRLELETCSPLVKCMATIAAQLR